MKLEVLTSSRRAERSWTLKQRIKTLTLLEYYRVHYVMYCKIALSTFIVSYI